MNNQELNKLRYPIGKFSAPDQISDEQLKEWIDTLDHYPSRLRKLVERLTEQQLETPYRPGGWTVRQLVHHISDSHHNSYIRFKWALTEDTPVIKVYNEKKWAELHDTRNSPIELSLKHLEAVHAKLVNLLRGLDDADFKSSFVHPDDNVTTDLKENVGRYVWHGNHHFTHIERLMQRENWT